MVLLRCFQKDKNTAIDRFKQFNELENGDNCLDDLVNEKAGLTDEEAKQAILNLIGEIGIAKIKSLSK